MTREQEIALVQHMQRLQAFCTGMGRKQGAHGMWTERDHAECERLEKALKTWVTQQLRDAAAKGRHDERGEE